MNLQRVFGLLSVVVLTACGSGNASDSKLGDAGKVSPPKPNTEYTGPVGDFSGKYFGAITMSMNGETQSAGKLQLTIVQTSTEIESISISSAGTGPVNFSRHIIQGNELIDPIDNAHVGKISSQGFYLERAGLGRLTLTWLNPAQLEISVSHQLMGPTVLVTGTLDRVAAFPTPTPPPATPTPTPIEAVANFTGEYFAEVSGTLVELFVVQGTHDLMIDFTARAGKNPMKTVHSEFKIKGNDVFNGYASVVGEIRQMHLQFYTSGYGFDLIRKPSSVTLKVSDFFAENEAVTVEMNQRREGLFHGKYQGVVTFSYGNNSVQDEVTLEIEQYPYTLSKVSFTFAQHAALLISRMDVYGTEIRSEGEPIGSVTGKKMAFDLTATHMGYEFELKPDGTLSVVKFDLNNTADVMFGDLKKVP